MNRFASAAGSGGSGGAAHPLEIGERIPAGTPHGRTLRVRGKGGLARSGRRGDLLVTVDVAVPAALSDAEREAVEALRVARGGRDPREDLFKAVKS